MKQRKKRKKVHGEGCEGYNRTTEPLSNSGTAEEERNDGKGWESSNPSAIKTGLKGLNNKIMQWKSSKEVHH